MDCLGAILWYENKADPFPSSKQNFFFFQLGFWVTSIPLHTQMPCITVYETTEQCNGNKVRCFNDEFFQRTETMRYCVSPLCCRLTFHPWHHCVSSFSWKGDRRKAVLECHSAGSREDLTSKFNYMNKKEDEQDYFRARTAQ